MPTNHASHLLAAIPAGVIGLVMGSFAGVLIDRVPHGDSISKPGSHCGSCDAPIAPRDNIPVLSYLLLRGKCRSCGAKIPPWTMIIEIVTCLLFAAVTVRLASFAALPAYLVFVTALVSLSAIDIQHRRLPSVIIYWAGGIGAALLVVASAVLGDWAAMLHALIGAAAAFLAFFAIYLAVPRGMGFGDVRLSALCGLFLGWLGLRVVPIGILAGFVLAGLPALLLVIMGKANRKTQFPFGPYLAAGAVVGVLFGPAIAHWWVTL